MQYLQPKSDILELNSWYGWRCLVVCCNLATILHATDISAGMLEQLKKRKTAAGLESRITAEQISFTNLTQLHNKKTVWLYLFQFCRAPMHRALNKVLESFSWLLKPGGFVTLVLLPRFCLWEFCCCLRENLKRLSAGCFQQEGSQKAHIEGVNFTCWYYNPSL